MKTEYKYGNGDYVKFDNGVFSGEAHVRGYATIAFPIMGAMVILEQEFGAGELPNDEYPFRTFTCAECHIKKCDKPGLMY